MKPVPDTMSCGCRLVWRGSLAHLYPCSKIHRTVAALARTPGSKIVIHAAPSEKTGD